MLELVQRLVRDESGGTAIEYALIASGIFLAIIVSVGEVGTELVKIFTSVKAGIKS